MNLNPNQSVVKSKATAITCGKKRLYIWKTNALIQYLKYKLNEKNTIYTKWENDSLCGDYDKSFSVLLWKLGLHCFYIATMKKTWLFKSSHYTTIVKLQTKLNLWVLNIKGITLQLLYQCQNMWLLRT